MSGKAIGAIAALGAVGAVGYLGYFGLSGYQASQIEKEIEAAIAEYEPQATFEYESVRSGFLSSSAEIFDAELTLQTGETIHFDRVVGDKRGYVEMENGIATLTTGDTINIDRVIVHEFDTENENPTFAKISVEGVTLGNTAALGPQTMALGSLGYSLEELASDIEMEYNFNESAQELDVSFSQSIAEVGSFSGSMVVGNVDSEEIFGDTEFEQANATLVSMELSYQDDSLIPRIYDFVSNLQQISVGDVQQQALGFVDQFQRELPDGEFRRQATTAAATFIEEPRSLTISVTPNSPLSFNDISQDLFDKRDIDYFVNYFGLSVAANAL